MSEKRNPLDWQDHPHREGNVNNTPPRTRTQEAKEENSAGNKKASSSEKNRTGEKPGNRKAENAAEEP